MEFGTTSVIQESDGRDGWPASSVSAPALFLFLFVFFFCLHLTGSHINISHCARPLSLFLVFLSHPPPPHTHTPPPSPPRCCLFRLFDVTLLICKNTLESRSAFMHTFCCPVRRLLKRPNPSKFRPSRVSGGGGGGGTLSVPGIWNITAPPSLKLPQKTKQGSSRHR